MRPWHSLLLGSLEEFSNKLLDLLPVETKVTVTSLQVSTAVVLLWFEGDNGVMKMKEVYADKILKRRIKEAGSKWVECDTNETVKVSGYDHVY